MDEYLDFEQPIVYSTLSNMCEKQQVPHALIFYGGKSTSKLEMALHLVKLLYSKELNIPLDDEILNKRVDDHSLTNLFIIEPVGTTIKKAQISEIILEASKSSLEDGPKIFIFKEADKLNDSSSNSLLKFIEEPEDDIYIILLVDNLESMLQTIKSRCAIISFKPLSKDAVKDRLKDEIDEDTLSILSEYTTRIDEIKKINEDDELLRLISLVQELFLEDVENKGSTVLYMKDYYNLLDRDLKKEEFFLSLFVLYLMDILNYKMLQKEEFTFISCKDRIKQLSQYVDKDRLSFIIKEALEIKKRLSSSINFRVNIDLLMLDTELSFRSN